MQKLKLVLGTFIELFQDIKAKYADKKLSILELVQLSGWIDDLVLIALNVKQYKEMYLNLKPAEKSELINWFNEKFNLDNDKTEKSIETIFAIIIHLSDLASFLVAIPKIKVEDDKQIPPSEK